MPIKETRNVPSDIEIAQAHEMEPIKDIAAKIGLAEEDLDYYGKYKAKVHLDLLDIRLYKYPLEIADRALTILVTSRG